MMVLVLGVIMPSVIVSRVVVVMRVWLSGRLGFSCRAIVIENRVALVDALVEVFVVFHAVSASALEVNLLSVERAALIAVVIISYATIWNLGSANGVRVHLVPVHELLIVLVQEALNSLHHFVGVELGVGIFPTHAIVNDH